MMGNLLVEGPGLCRTRCSTNGSSRYPKSTALRRDKAASVSVPWMMASWAGVERGRPPPPLPRPLPRPLLPPREFPRRLRRLGIEGADMDNTGTPPYYTWLVEEEKSELLAKIKRSEVSKVSASRERAKVMCRKEL